MERPVRLLSMIAAAVLAAPAAMAGDVFKCVDATRHVTLTDQPCAAGTIATRLDRGAAPDDGMTPVVQRHVVAPAELRHAEWKRPVVANVATATATPALAGDVATLKAARRMLLQQDARPRLAGLD